MHQVRSVLALEFSCYRCRGRFAAHKFFLPARCASYNQFLTSPTDVVELHAVVPETSRISREKTGRMILTTAKMESTRRVILLLATLLLSMLLTPTLGWPQTQKQANPTGSEPIPEPAIPAILAAFDKYEVVGLPQGHGMQDLDDLILSLIRNPAFSEKVNDIEFECGSSLYQPKSCRLHGDCAYWLRIRLLTGIKSRARTTS